jgi:hypothetical protein
VTGSGKRSSLLRHGINYSRERFYSMDPWTGKNLRFNFFVELSLLSSLFLSLSSLHALSDIHFPGTTTLSIIALIRTTLSITFAYTECRLLIVMLSVVMLSIVILRLVILSVVVQCVVMMSVVRLNIVMLSDVMLNIFTLECFYTQFCCVGCC